MNLRRLSIVLLAAVIAGAGGAMIYHWFSARNDDGRRLPAETEDLVGQPRPPYRLGDSDGAWVSAEDFDGQPVLVNFWATWCAPCRKEMPMLSALHQDYACRGLQVVGIALDDVAQAREFAAELGIGYPILVGGADVMAVVRSYGNISGVLPYTVLIDREGIIRWTHLGEVDRAMLERAIEPVL